MIARLNSMYVFLQPLAQFNPPILLLLLSPSFFYCFYLLKKGDLQKQSEKGAMAVDDLAEQLDQITASLDLINTTHLDAVSSAAEVSGAIFDEVGIAQ